MFLPGIHLMKGCNTYEYFTNGEIKQLQLVNSNNRSLHKNIN